MAKPPRLIQTPFDTELFTELLTGTIASRVRFQKAHLCPCRSERTGPDPYCAVCGGRGYYYDAGVDVRAGVQGVKHREEYRDRGVVDEADLQITVSRYQEDHATANPAWDAARGDRVLLPDSRRREQYHAERRGATDTLRFRNVTDVQLASIRDDSVHAWVEGVDYTLAGNVVTWLAGRGPASGEHYAVDMHIYPLYHVFRELPQLRHMDTLDLPRRFGLKLGEWKPDSGS